MRRKTDAAREKTSPMLKCTGREAIPAIRKKVPGAAKKRVAVHKDEAQPTTTIVFRGRAKHGALSIAGGAAVS